MVVRRRCVTFLFFLLLCFDIQAQEFFSITQYDIKVNVNKDASLDITEIIKVHFNERRHGIIRLIPYRYKLQPLPEGTQKANRQMEHNGYAHTIVDNIQVEGQEFSVSNAGDNKEIKIGSADEYVNGDQQYIIRYTIKNAINFFNNHSELYLNLIGNGWATSIDQVNFSIHLHDSLTNTPPFFIATGYEGSQENSTASTWTNNRILSGKTTRRLNSNEGLTVGIIFPKDFLTKTTFTEKGIKSYTTNKWEIKVKVNKDASLDVTEMISIHCDEPLASFSRTFPAQPFRYKFESLSQGTFDPYTEQQYPRPHEPVIKNFQVMFWDFNITRTKDYLTTLHIKPKKGFFSGDQHIIIKYTVIDAIDFLEDHDELYFSFIDDNLLTSIDAVKFSVELYKPLPDQPASFLYTGFDSFKQGNFITQWSDHKKFSGYTTEKFEFNQQLTLGIVFPKDFITQPNYSLRGIEWLLLPAAVFTVMLFIWLKWGKDKNVVVQTEFYPPAGISPAIAGYLIDDILNRRDLTALIPYWGAGGYIQVKEIENDGTSSSKKSTYEFIKLKDLPEDAMLFEKTLFAGIFQSKNRVWLSNLKNKLYLTMNTAKTQLETEVEKGGYYEKKTKKLRSIFIAIGIFSLFLGMIGIMLSLIFESVLWSGVACILSAIIIIIFGIYMPKKSKVGTEIYQKLLGFKEFIRMVEKSRLEQFLKEDEHYFDKVLPYAIVFGIADKWKDKLKDISFSNPNWYVSNNSSFTTGMFLNSLDRSMSEMSKNFYSTPSSSSSSNSSWGSSGGSWSSSGGSSGGGFGGGGGSSW